MLELTPKAVYDTLASAGFPAHFTRDKGVTVYSLAAPQEGRLGVGYHVDRAAHPNYRDLEEAGITGCYAALTDAGYLTDIVSESDDRLLVVVWIED